MSEPIQVTRDGAVQIIRINRPEKKNALTQAMYAVMTQALRDADALPEIRATVFFGLPGMFSAGNDLNDFLGFAQGGKLGTDVTDFLQAIASGGKPMLAGVDGLAVGVGTTLLLHCDFVVASERAILSTPFVGLGLVPEAGSSLIAPRLMGHARAFELLVMGRRFSAARGREAGIINEIVSSDELEARTLAAAKEIAALPAEAVAVSRALLRGDRAPVLERIAEEAKIFGERLRSDEARQAFMAFFARKG